MKLLKGCTISSIRNLLHHTAEILFIAQQGSTPPPQTTCGFVLGGPSSHHGFIWFPHLRYLMTFISPFHGWRQTEIGGEAEQPRFNTVTLDLKPVIFKPTYHFLGIPALGFSSFPTSSLPAVKTCSLGVSKCHYGQEMGAPEDQESWMIEIVLNVS